MAKNFYAIRKGKDPVTGEDAHNVILTSWAETQKYIKGVKAVEFSGFMKREDAEDYLREGNPLMNKKDGKFRAGGMHCYIDGSYSADSNNYSYAVVFVSSGAVIDTESGVGKNAEAASMNQIGGELLGAMKSLLYAKRKRIKEVTIFHDYVGTCYHAVGYWDRNNKHSEVYYDWMQKFFKENPDMSVQFFKVDAHDGDDFNEIADGLAKLALNVKPDKIFYKMVEKHNITLQ